MNTLMGGSGGVDSSGTDWIRFTDGTQICWMKDKDKPDVTTSLNVYPTTLTFPQPFASVPYVVTGAEYDSTYKNIAIPNLGSITTTACTVYLFRVTAGNANSVAYYVVAIGKWK